MRRRRGEASGRGHTSADCWLQKCAGGGRPIDRNIDRSDNPDEKRNSVRVLQSAGAFDGCSGQASGTLFVRTPMSARKA